jgi:hypothetical protein
VSRGSVVACAAALGAAGIGGALALGACNTGPARSDEATESATAQPAASATAATGGPSASGSASPAASACTPAAPTPPAGAAPALADGPIVPPHDGVTRIYAKSRFVWIRYEPSPTSGWTGFMWTGGAVRTKSPTPVPGSGDCPAWYPIEPRGFVCADGVNATTDRDDPAYVALLPHTANVQSPYPFSYGESREVQRYRSLPSIAEQKSREWDYQTHQDQLAAAKGGGEVHSSLVGVDFKPGTDPIPLFPEVSSTLREERKRIALGSTISWSREVEHEGRTFLLGADFAWFPKDRVVPYPEVTFHGTPLGNGLELPVGFIREKARPQYKKDDKGGFVANGESWPRLAIVPLSATTETVEGVTYLETKAPGIWIAEKDVTVARAPAASPWGKPMTGERLDEGARGDAPRRWLEVSVLGGWLVAYEGTKAVYTTMISPGRGGIPERGIDPLKTASTPVGEWPISGKFIHAMMVHDETLIHSDVPWTQNFHGPHAIHTAYWHDKWGEKMSGGCVNVSPIDGKWLFGWTDPPLPEGWHGMRLERDAPSTRMVVHR